VLEACQSQSGKLEVLQADVGVSEQIGLVVGGGQQLRRNGATVEQAADPPRGAAAHAWLRQSDLAPLSVVLAV